MKKIFFVFLIFVFLSGFFGFFSFSLEDSNDAYVDSHAREEVRGVFISYIDYGMFRNKTATEVKNFIYDMVNNISDFGFNAIVLEVSPFSDAIYPSSIYLSSSVVVLKEGDSLPVDILGYFIDVSSKKGIDVFAWFNPYRIRSTNDMSSINENSYYYKWFGTDNIEVSDDGIYLNPASYEVIDYITSGLKEVVSNYDVKGVLFDDYFYPNKTIDLNSYEKSGKKVSLDEFRINNINLLLSESYSAIKSVDKNVMFGIAPAGNIDNNLSSEYLDIKQVLKKDYLDFVAPQLYFGFDNSVKPYIDALNEWSKLNIFDKDLYVSVAIYKSGKVDKFAGSGKYEWMEHSDIIKRQILVSRNVKNYKGFFVFRYDYLFKDYKNDYLRGEVTNLKKLIGDN